MEPRPVRIAIVNDYEVVVMGLARMLEPYSDRIEVVEIAVNTVVTEPVDIVLYDAFSQPEVGAGETASLLQDLNAGRVVVYSWNPPPADAGSGLGNGAAGYLGKGLSPLALVVALEQINAGERLVSEDGPLTDLASGDWPGRGQGLTVRESEIIALITQGLSNQEIANRAYLSINTVKSYIRSSYRKMGVASRSRALLWGLEHGFRPDHVRPRHPVADPL